MRHRMVAFAAANVLAAGALVAAVAVAAPAQATTLANTVSGVLKYPDGTPAAGKPIKLLGVPLDDGAVGSVVTKLPIDTTVTDALGRYTLTASTASAVVTLANQNEGVLNAVVESVFDQAALAPVPGAETEVHVAVVGVVFDLVNDPITGLGFVGPGTVDLQTVAASTSIAVTGTDVTVSANVPAAGATVAPSPQPDPDPEMSTDPVVTNAVEGVAAAQETASETGVDTTGVANVDSTTVRTIEDTATNATGTSAIVNEIKADAGDAGGGSDPHQYPDDPCPDDYQSDSIRYPMTYITYSYPKWVPVGELHIPTRSTGKLTFETSKYTNIGFGTQINGKGWSVAGYTRPAKTVGAGNGVQIETTSSVWGRHIKALYRFHDTRTYYCKGSPNGSVVYSIYDERRPIYWNGTVVAASTDLSNWDSKSRYDAAVANNRAQRFYYYNTPFRDSGEGYKYVNEMCVLGLCVGSETDYTTTTRLNWSFDSPSAGGRQYYWLFGNAARPLEEGAKIVYA